MKLTGCLKCQHFKPYFVLFLSLKKEKHIILKKAFHFTLFSLPSWWLRDLIMIVYIYTHMHISIFVLTLTSVSFYCLLFLSSVLYLSNRRLGSLKRHSSLSCPLYQIYCQLVIKAIQIYMSCVNSFFFRKNNIVEKRWKEKQKKFSMGKEKVLCIFYFEWQLIGQKIPMLRKPWLMWTRRKGEIFLCGCNKQRYEHVRKYNKKKKNTILFLLEDDEDDGILS